MTPDEMIKRQFAGHDNNTIQHGKRIKEIRERSYNEASKLFGNRVKLELPSVKLGLVHKPFAKVLR